MKEISDLPPLKGGPQQAGPPPLQGGLPPLQGGMPPLRGADASLEADAALGLSLSTPVGPRRSVSSYEGIPESELDTTIPIRDPESGVPMGASFESGLHEAPATRAMEAIRLASAGASSSPAEEARKALVVARDMNVDPEFVRGKTKEFEATKQLQDIEKKIYTFPMYSRLTKWMAQNRANAAAIQNELDSWSLIDWMGGKFVYDQEKLQKWNAGDPVPQSTYQQPGWMMQWGRTLYQMSNSMQTHFMSLYGPTKDTGKSLDEIKAQRDISMFPIPGETVYVPTDTGKMEPMGKERPGLQRANSLVGMLPIIAASTIHPALGGAMIYSETAGRTYEDMRLAGWDHEQSTNISELVGFTAGAIGAAMGPMFKFSFLPKATLLGMQGVPNAALMSITKSPTLWRAFLGLGKNFVASTAMNMTMAGAEVAISEAFDSAREGRPYSHSKVASAARDAGNAWAEMLMLSVVPAVREHQARKQGYKANAELTQDQMDRARFVEAVYNNYEARGQDLRSMHEASKIVAYAQALKDSEFIKTNPEDARDLLQKLLAPRASQTVYLKPEAVAKLPPDTLDALGVDASLTANEGRVPVNLADLLMHPDAETLANIASGGPDLKSASELGSVDLSKPIDPPPEVRGQDVTDERLDEWLKADKARMNGKDPARQPTEREIHSAVQGALDQDVFAPRNAQGAVPPAPEKRRPAPDLGAKERPAKKPLGPPPMTEDGIKRWAQDAVLSIPSSELQSMAEHYGRRAEEHNREEKEALRGERTPASQNRANEAARKYAVTSALHKALTSADETVRSHVEYFTAQASDEKLSKGQQTPREAAWFAGEVYGAAHDAILEALGVGGVKEEGTLPRPRGHAAPDVSDAYDKVADSRSSKDVLDSIYQKLAQTGRLPKDGFEGWDLQAANKSIEQRATMPERTLADLNMLRSALEQISKAADAENSARIFNLNVAKAQIVQELAEHFKNIPDVPPGQRMTVDNTRALSTGQATDKDRGSLAAELNQPTTLMLKLGKIGESLLFESFIPGEVREVRMWGDVDPVIREIAKNTPEEISKMGRDKIRFPDGSLHLRSDTWDMMLKSGTQGADTKIAHSLGFKDDYKNKVTAEQQYWNWLHSNFADTPENAHAIMQNIITPHWKVYENYLWSEYAQMFKEVGLAPPEKLKPAKITFHGVDYKGSYGGRIKWWVESGNQPVIHPGSLEALYGSDNTGPTTPHRQLLERDPDFLGKPIFSWDGVVGDLRKEIHDISMRPFVETAHKIFSDSAVRELVGNKMGHDALNEIYDPNGKSSWLHTVARGTVADVQSAEAWAQKLHKLQGLAAYSAFSLNVKVMLGQLSHIPAAMFALGSNPIHAVEGITAAFNPDRRAWAHAASPDVLGLRYADYEERAITLTRELTGLEPGRDPFRRGTDHVSWMAYREMDAFLSHAIWEMEYAKAIGKYQIGADAVGHDEAVRRANIGVLRMMPPQDIYNHSSFVRDRSVLGFSYLVRNFPSTLSNVTALNWWSARLQGGATTWEGAAGRAKTAAQYVGMVLAAHLLGGGYIMQGGPRDDEEPEKWYQRRVLGAMFYPYMIAEPATAAAMALQGDTYGARHEIDHMMPASITVIGQAIYDIGRLAQGGDEEAALRAAAHLSGLILKTPLTGAAYNLSNALRNSQSPQDALMKGLGYRR